MSKNNWRAKIASSRIVILFGDKLGATAGGLYSSLKLMVSINYTKVPPSENRRELKHLALFAVCHHGSLKEFRRRK
jgi:hypothetical protein